VRAPAHLGAHPPTSVIICMACAGPVAVSARAAVVGAARAGAARETRAARPFARAFRPLGAGLKTYRKFSLGWRRCMSDSA